MNGIIFDNEKIVIRKANKKTRSNGYDCTCYGSYKEDKYVIIDRENRKSVRNLYG